MYLIQPGTVVRVVNSYAATSLYTPARLDSRVDLPTDGKPTNPILESLTAPQSNTDHDDNAKMMIDDLQVSHPQSVIAKKGIYVTDESSVDEESGSDDDTFGDDTFGDDTDLVLEQLDELGFDLNEVCDDEVNYV